MEFATQYFTDLVEQFQKLKSLADKALARVSDEEFFKQIDRESNSLAVVCKHIGGNLRSRWQDFLTSDGEKPDRNRDQEFDEETVRTRPAVMEIWEHGWRAAIESLRSLRAEDINKDVFIRGERHSVVQAANRSLQHTSYHVGQIVFLARHLHPDEWQSLSIPRKQSDAFNKRAWGTRTASGRE
jgi:Protein of unknown function (DUF1572)